MKRAIFLGSYISKNERGYFMINCKGTLRAGRVFVLDVGGREDGTYIFL